MPESPVLEDPRSSTELKALFRVLVREMMAELMGALAKNPFDLDDMNSKRAYHILLPELVFRAAHVERRFVTRLGKLWERVAQIAGEWKGHSQSNRKIVGTVGKDRLARISDIVEGRFSEAPNWEKELNHVREVGGEPREVVVICDVFIASKAGDLGEAFELKSPKPNRGQGAAVRRDLLTLYTMKPRQITDAYLGLPYNPYGTREDYKWRYITRYFDVAKKDPRLLIGRELWEKVGRGDAFDELMEVIREINAEFHQAIFTDCLQMPSPNDAD